MELDDLPEVFKLGEELFTADRWPTLYRTWDPYELIALFSSDGDFCLVAEMDDKIVGFVLGTMITKRNSAWDYGHLLWLGVRSNVAKKGVGRRLVEWLTDIFIEAGARMMIVDTQAENEAAIAFFGKMGFGNESQHIYLYRNLTTLPGYKRMREDEVAEKAFWRARRSRRRHAEPHGDEPHAGPFVKPEEESG
jgi:ribosomal protein S18 acetylase RimI-like enzyme